MFANISEAIRNPFEKERTVFRPHGFDNIDAVYQVVVAEHKNNDNLAFNKKYSNGKQYLFVKSENQTERSSRVEVDAGYIDFQDGEHVSMARIELMYYPETKDITVLFAADENVPSIDIDNVLNTIQNGGFLQLRTSD